MNHTKTKQNSPKKKQRVLNIHFVFIIFFPTNMASYITLSNCTQTTFVHLVAQTILVFKKEKESILQYKKIYYK